MKTTAPALPKISLREAFAWALDFDDDEDDEKSPDVESPSSPTFYDNVIDAVRAVAPEGSTIRPIGFDRADMFLRAGYRAVDGERADITIARGGEREFALARENADKYLILCPTHAFAAAATDRYRTQDKAFAIMRRGRKPNAVAIDKTDVDRNLASIFGEIVSLDLCAFDLTFGAYMRGERTDATLVETIAKLVADLTAELRSLEKNTPEITAALVRAGEKAAKTVEAKPELLHASGAAQTAEALRMLYAAEDRPLAMRGETEMLVGRYVAEFYIKNLTSDKFEFPPDNGKRIDSVCEYLGADVRRACVYASPIYPPAKMRLCEYRRAEFRAEQMRMLAALKKRQTAAFAVFKRLYPDDGYGLKSLIDPTDLALCLALAPDVFCADSMLSFLKQSGRLEKYIV